MNTMFQRLFLNSFKNFSFIFTIFVIILGNFYWIFWVKNTSALTLGTELVKNWNFSSLSSWTESWNKFNIADNAAIYESDAPANWELKQNIVISDFQPTDLFRVTFSIKGNWTRTWLMSKIWARVSFWDQILYEKLLNWNEASETISKDVSGKDLKNLDFIIRGTKNDSSPAAADFSITDVSIKRISNTVTFSGSDITPFAKDVISGRAISEPNPIPTKTGYNFDWWYNSATKFDFSTPINQDTTLTAKFSPKIFTVNFQNEDGTIFASQNIPYSQNAQVLSTSPQKAGYDFVSWQKNGADFNFSTQIIENTILTPKFSPKKFTIKFLGEDSVTEISTQNIDYNSLVSAPTTPTKNGWFQFSNWEIISGTNIWQKFNLSTPITENLTLKAVFTEIPKKNIILNEIAYRLDSSEAYGFQNVKDWVELYNPTDSEIDISGFALKDGTDGTTGYSDLVFPSWTKIPAKWYITFANEDFSPKYWFSPSVIKNTTGTLGLWFTGNWPYFVTLVDNYGRQLDFFEWTKFGETSTLLTNKINTQNFCRISWTWQNNCLQTPNAENSVNALTFSLSNNSVNNGLSSVEVWTFSLSNQNNLDKNFRYQFFNTTSQKYSHDYFEIKDWKLFVKSPYLTDFYSKPSHLLKVEVIGDRGSYGVQDFTIHVKEPLYNVNFDFQNKSPNFTLPSTIVRPDNILWKKFGEKITLPLVASPVLDATNDGKWIFDNWNNMKEVTIWKENLTITWSWTFVPNTYNANFTFANLDTLPTAIKSYLQNEPTQTWSFWQKISPKNLTFAPVEVVNASDPAKTGKWSFVSWDANEKIFEKSDVNFVGTWKFSPKTATIKYSYTENVDGKDLPTELVPPADETANYGEEKIPTAPEKSVFEVTDGTWSTTGFVEKWLVDSPEKIFTANWTFLPSVSETPIANYVKIEFISDFLKTEKISGNQIFYVNPLKEVTFSSPTISPKNWYIFKNFENFSENSAKKYSENTTFRAIFDTKNAITAEKTIKFSENIPEITDFITNISELPEWTTFSWENGDAPKNNKIPETQNKKILVKYPDGSEKSVSAIVKIIDDSAPTGNISANITTPTNSDVTLTLVVDEILQKIPNGWQQDTTNPKIFTKIISENGIVHVEIEDLSGNKNSLTFEVKNIDKTSPAGTISPDKTDWTKDNVTLTLKTSKPIETPNDWKKVDDTTFTKIIEENTNNKVILIDTVGNSSLKIAYDVPNIDKNKPVIVSLLTSGNTNLVTESSIVVNFSGEDGKNESSIKKFQCSLNNAEFIDCNSPFTFSNLQEWANKISVKAIDHALNESETKNISVVKDSIAPKILTENVTFPVWNEISEIILKSDEENVKFAISWKLPDWLLFDGEKITWTPTKVWEFSLEISATDEAWNIWKKVLKINIFETTPPKNTGNLPTTPVIPVTPDPVQQKPQTSISGPWWATSVHTINSNTKNPEIISPEKTDKTTIISENSSTNSPKSETKNTILPSQSFSKLDSTNKNGQQIFSYENRVTDYICPKFIKIFDENAVIIKDISPKNAFRDDMYAMIMFRGLEQDEASIGQTYEEYKKWWVAINDKNFEPMRNVTRAEFVKMLVRALSCRYTFLGKNTPFSDISEKNWYAEYITFAVKNKWITGYSDGTFRPNNPITRAEAAKILANAIHLNPQKNTKNNPFTDISNSSEFLPYVLALRDQGIMKGKTSKDFSPLQYIPRTETSRIIYRTFFGGNN